MSATKNSDMTLEQLKMLKLVAEQGTLKSASELLFKTQPAISQGIKQLETLLGIKIFNREGYRLKLTNEGEQVYRKALRLLSEASEIQQLSKHLAQGNEASITIAIEASYDLNRILPILENTQNAFPRTQIILRQEYLSGAFEAVENDQAELAITPIGILNIESGVFDANWLYQGHLINVAAPRLLLRHPDLKLVDELRSEYQIIVQDSGHASKGKNYNVQEGQRCWFANDFSTKKTLIMSGMGWGRLPEGLITQELENGSLVKLRLKDIKTDLDLNYYAIKRKSRVLGPVASKLWKSLSAQGDSNKHE